jgi:hypothetical protein
MKMTMMVGMFLAAAGLFGQAPKAGDAFVRQVTGTVEMKAPGAADWTPVRQGQRLSGETIVSTGFNSQAIISLGRSSINMRPLTRLSVTALFHSENREEVKLDLRIGRLRADVKPPLGGKVDFTVRSYIGTASVRGTVFEFDTLNLAVSEGTVEFAGTSGAPVLVDRGGATLVDGITGRPVPPAELAAAGLRPEPPQGAEAITAAGTAETAPRGPAPMSVSVTF